MNVKIDYKATKKIVDKLGIEALLNFAMISYPELELYSISEDWLDSEQYICKCRGIYGDLIIEWI